MNTLHIRFALLRSLSLLSLAFVLTACVKVAYLANAVVSPPELTRVKNQRGEPLDIYHFDTAEHPRRAIYFVTGSGCSSLRYYLNQYFNGLEGSYRVFGLQKSGVNAFAAGGRCSDAFNEHYTAEILQKRNADALSWVQEHFDGDIAAIVGVSEGGVIAASLAANHPEIARLVIIGSGAMTFREELMMLADRRGETAALQSGLANVASHPDSTTEAFLGLPHRYLTSMLDLDPRPIYAQTTQSALLLAGGEDESVPVESMHRLGEELKQRPTGKVNLEIIPGANHVLKRDGRDMKPVIMQRLSRWLTGEPWTPLR